MDKKMRQIVIARVRYRRIREKSKPPIPIRDMRYSSGPSEAPDKALINLRAHSNRSSKSRKPSMPTMPWDTMED